MRVSDLGEFGLIEALCRRVPTTSPDLRLAVGDDAALWRARGWSIATTDTMVEDSHFRLGEIEPAELGWKALAVNLSDIAALGGVPRWALVTLGLSRQLPADLLFGIYDGLGEACRAYGTVVAGGDVVSSRALCLTVALLGEPSSPEGAVLERAAARPGDLIAVTGALGGSAAWLEPAARLAPHAALAAIRRAHFRPIPRLREGQLLLQAGVRCAMDVSDGLVGDLGHICRASGVSARLAPARIPVQPEASAALGPDRALELALHGGEDYELLVCAPERALAAAQLLLQQETGTPLTVIGEIAASEGDDRGRPVSLVAADGSLRPAARGGWDHLRGPDRG